MRSIVARPAEGPGRRTRPQGPGPDRLHPFAKYQSEYAGRVQYYLLAQDVFRLGRLHWVMETSLLKTLGAP